jgi:hypothetical protein
MASKKRKLQDIDSSVVVVVVDRESILESIVYKSECIIRRLQKALYDTTYDFHKERTLENQTSLFLSDCNNNESDYRNILFEQYSNNSLTLTQNELTVKHEIDDKNIKRNKKIMSKSMKNFKSDILFVIMKFLYHDKIETLKLVCQLWYHTIKHYDRLYLNIQYVSSCDLKAEYMKDVNILTIDNDNEDTRIILKLLKIPKKTFTLLSFKYKDNNVDDECIYIITQNHILIQLVSYHTIELLEITIPCIDSTTSELLLKLQSKVTRLCVFISRFNTMLDKIDFEQFANSIFYVKLDVSINGTYKKKYGIFNGKTIIIKKGSINFPIDKTVVDPSKSNRRFVDMNNTKKRKAIEDAKITFPKQFVW